MKFSDLSREEQKEIRALLKTAKYVIILFIEIFLLLSLLLNIILK